MTYRKGILVKTIDEMTYIDLALALILKTPVCVGLTRGKERKYICPHMNYKFVELSVGLNECDHIRKLLNKNHMSEVPSKAAKSWKWKALRIGHVNNSRYKVSCS